MTTPRSTTAPTDAETRDARRIVVGVDGSAQSHQALRWAEFLAAGTGATIEAVYAWEYPVSAGGWTAFPTDWHPDQDAEKVLTQAVDGAFGSERPRGLTLHTREGHPVRVLVEASQGAQLLVVGSRGHGGFVGLLLGSVSASCAEHAGCPVLVVHNEQPPARATA